LPLVAATALAAAVVGGLRTPARTCRRWRRRGGSSGGGEGSCWSFLTIRHGEFLKNEVFTSFQERGEGLGTTKEGADVGEALVEAADEVEDEGTIGDDLAEGREIISHLLQSAAVVGDGEVPLHEVAKLRLQLNGASLPIAEELRLHREPGVPGCGALGADDLTQIVREGGEIGTGGSSRT
jgi:hypothetical protein